MMWSSTAPKVRPDTSIAQRAMSMIHPKFQGLKDQWIISTAETSPPPSIGLSDLMMLTLPRHSPSLRFGLCWYRIGLSDLVIDLSCFIGLRATLISDRSFRATGHRIPPRDKGIVVPLARQSRQLLPAPTERLDTSIARSNAQGYDHPHRTFSGLKDRWIYARMTVFKPFTPSPF